MFTIELGSSLRFVEFMASDTDRAATCAAVDALADDDDDDIESDDVSCGVDIGFLT